MFFFSSRRRHTRCALVTGVQTCALPILSRSLEAAHYEPGSIIGSEQELREQHNAGRALFRQAMRILEYRGIIRLRRGLGGGVIFVGQEDTAIARDLARLIESQTADAYRSEEHTSELQSLMRISYAVFCLKKKKTKSITMNNTSETK